jgi:hypothetical protein
VPEAVKPFRTGFVTLREALATPDLRRVQAAGAASSLAFWCAAWSRTRRPVSPQFAAIVAGIGPKNPYFLARSRSLS